jgi:hypothetical protein
VQLLVFINGAETALNNTTPNFFVYSAATAAANFSNDGL